MKLLKILKSFIINQYSLGGDLDVLKFGELCNKLQARYGDVVRFQMFDRKQVIKF